MSFRTCVHVFLVLLSTATFEVFLAAQAGVTLSGRLLNSLSGEPIGAATVQINELKRRTISAPDGTFAFENVAPGDYHLSVQFPGYSSRRIEVTVSTAAVQAGDLRIDPELHFDVSVTGGEPRSTFEAFQPTSVLAGQEMSKRLEMSLGATLDNQPGVASRSFGPAPARPVIRGLGGDRVLILQDGQRMGDLSSQSGDHGVTVNPAFARRLEVVRGPATLLYGANAVGGLVNVITDEIPTRPVTGARGKVSFDLGSAAREGGAAGSVTVGNGTFALQAGGAGRRSSDYDTPDGEVLNSQSRSGFGSVGLSWTGARGYAGGSYAYDDTKYGVPVVEEGQIQLTPRKHALSVRGGAEGLDGAFDAYRATLAVRRYRHDELEGGEVGTSFTNDTTEVEVMAAHRAVGRLKGSAGAWIFDRAFDAVGAEALSPAVDQGAFAAFLYEELTWPHVTLQFAGRVDHATYEPFDEDTRDFTVGSGSVGLLFRPAAADDRLTIAVSAARAGRYPALEELFFFGPHPGNFAFEIGNPDLDPEHAFGFDISLRWRSARASGEITYFRNAVGDYVFTAPVTEEDFEGRAEEFSARFPGRGIGGEPDGEHEEHAHDEFPIVEYVGSDSVLQGIEAHADVSLTSNLYVEFGLDYVRGTLEDGGQPLPRIPPLRFRGGLRYQRNAFQAGGDVTAAASQDRIFETETPTAGYELLRLFASYSLGRGRAAHTITARLDNATNERYRNHLSLVKDLVPEMGRNFKVLYDIGF
jgi:iron complex outermembrane receptor protein